MVFLHPELPSPKDHREVRQHQKKAMQPNLAANGRKVIANVCDMINPWKSSGFFRHYKELYYTIVKQLMTPVAYPNGCLESRAVRSHWKSMGTGASQPSRRLFKSADSAPRHRAMAQRFDHSLPLPPVITAPPVTFTFSSTAFEIFSASSGFSLRAALAASRP